MALRRQIIEGLTLSYILESGEHVDCKIINVLDAERVLVEFERGGVRRVVSRRFIV